jgi:hypothetical protein
LLSGTDVPESFCFLLIGCTVAEVVCFANPYASWKGAQKIPTVIRPDFPNYDLFAGFIDKKVTHISIQSTISQSEN